MDGVDSSLPLQVEFQIRARYFSLFAPLQPVFTRSGNGSLYVAAPLPDAAGLDPFPAEKGTGCGNALNQTLACTDVAVYGFAPGGTLQFITYLAGRTRETPRLARLSADGVLVIGGTTDSDNFPATANAAQKSYGGPTARPYASGYFNNLVVPGDYFATRLNPASGTLEASTYYGGPEADGLAGIELGADGSLFILGRGTASLPVTRDALQGSCTSAGCFDGYAARLTPGLDRLLFATYLPGTFLTAKIFAINGSIYFAGHARSAFPVSATAYQRQPAGGTDGFVARLDPTGSRLLFATYLGTPSDDRVNAIAISPDASVWALSPPIQRRCLRARRLAIVWFVSTLRVKSFSCRRILTSQI